MSKPYGDSKKGLLSLVLVLICLACTSQAAFGQQDLCVPAIGGLVPSPAMDGVVDGDMGWNGAVQVGLRENMGVPKVGTLQLGRQGGFLYVSLEIAVSPTPGIDDLVLMSFSTTTNPVQDWRLEIQPFNVNEIASGMTYTNHNINRMSFWRNSNKWLTPMPSPLPAGDNSYWYYDNPVISTFPTGTIKISRVQNSWSMEAQIPISNNLATASNNDKIYIPSTGEFRFHFLVVSTNDLMGTFTQDTWPLTSLVTGTSGWLEQHTPPPSAWGTLSFNPRSACTGVYLSTSDVGVRRTSTPGGPLTHTSLTITAPFTNATGSVLSTAADCQTLTDDYNWPAQKSVHNYFVAIPRNNASTPAPSVYAKFYVAPWGIPGKQSYDWDLIGELYKPTGAPPVFSTPASTIPTDVSGAPRAELQTDWQLSYKQSCVYLSSDYYGSKGHHCIQAELYSDDPNTVFLNKSVQINHNFVSASKAELQANISMRGYGKPPATSCSDAQRRAGKCFHEMLLVVDKMTQSYAKREGFYIQAVDKMLSDRKPGIWSQQFRSLPRIPAGVFPKGLDEGLTWIGRGYLKTDNKLRIGTKSYVNAKYVGGFSYTAGHAGKLVKWIDNLVDKRAGQEIQVLDNGRVYLLRIPEEGSANFAAQVEAVEDIPPCKPTKCKPCPTVALTNSGNWNMPGAVVLIGGIAGVGGFAFRKRKSREGDRGKS